MIEFTGARPVPVLHFLANEAASVTLHDKIGSFALRNTVRSSGGAFRDYDPDRPMVRLQSTAVSSAPFPPSPLEMAAEAAAPAGNAGSGFLTKTSPPTPTRSRMPGCG